MEDNAKCAKLLLRNNLRGIKQNASAHLTGLQAGKKKEGNSVLALLPLSPSLSLPALFTPSAGRAPIVFD